MDKREELVQALKEIKDPELGVNIIDLGLIYRVDVSSKGNVEILMTLTTSGCPLADFIEGKVREVVMNVEGVSSVDVKITFDPPWTSDLMSDECRAELGFE